FNIACSTKQELMMFEMDQIHDFMKRFNNQVEVIWGITFDDNLDQDLKVTLLATGFNLMNVPQIQERTAHKTEEELAKERIKDEKRTIRLDTYYPDHKAKRRKRYLPYVLKLEEMDDDAVIASLENTPAYRRGMTIKDNHNV
ncbi:MAG TPA: cell division protein FtsZ, partial [Bacteroidales bacterium]|nr:cell division protein FtsZ [Bacteroidales bacterium]